MKAAELGSPGTAMFAPWQLGVAADGHRARPLPAILGDQLGPEIAKHALGVIAARQGLDHGGAARRCMPASSTADFTGADGTGRS